MKLSKDFIETVTQAIDGRSGDPLADENQTEEFLDGYLVGQLDDSDKSHGIVKEYQRRGCPESKAELAQFKEWKRGYWVGRWEALEIPDGGIDG